LRSLSIERSLQFGQMKYGTTAGYPRRMELWCERVSRRQVLLAAAAAVAGGRSPERSRRRRRRRSCRDRSAAASITWSS
jgi:hypothetical protein